MLSELTEKHSASDRTRAFTLLQVTFGLGSIVGAALGGIVYLELLFMGSKYITLGFLSMPVLHYPNIFGNLGFVTDFLISFPYFLPCFVAACLSSACWLLSFFYLEETLVKDIPSQGEEQALLTSEVSQYDSIDTTTTKHSSLRESMKEYFTSAVLAIVVLYSLVAFEALYYDGIHN